MSLGPRTSSIGVTALDTTQQSSCRPIEDLLGDDEPLDLARPFIDLVDLRVAHQLLDRVFLRVTVPAEDLDGVGRDAHRDVGREGLGEGGQLRVAAAVVDGPGRLPDEQSRRLDVLGHVRDHEAHGLVLRDRLAERRPLGCVLDGLVHGAAGQAHGPRRDRRTRVVEGAHRDLEAVAFLAKEVLRRDLHVLERDPPRVAGALPEVLLLLPDGDAGRLSRDDEARHSPVLGGRVRVGEKEVPVRDAGIRDPHLLAVDHVVVADPLRKGPDADHVGAGPRLGHAVSGEEGLARQPAEELLLLLLVAGHDDGRRGQPVGLHCGGDAGAAVGALLRDDAAVQDAQPRAAVLGGDMRVHQPDVPCLLHDLAREFARLVVVGRFRDDLFPAELPRQLLDLDLLFGQRKIDHVRAPFNRISYVPDVSGSSGGPVKRQDELAWKPTAHLYVADDRLVMESNTPKVDIEEPMTFADGRTIWLRINKVPLRDAGGAVFGVLGTYEDITVQRQAAVDLHESEERFRATFEQAAVGICLLYTDGVRCLACHVLESLGYSVLCAESGGQALDLARDHRGKIDLVLTDVVMPEMSGREVERRLAEAGHAARARAQGARGA